MTRKARFTPGRAGFATRMRQLARRFVIVRAGVAAIEFALVLPLLVIVYLGMTELTFAISTDRKLTLLSRSLADLVGRTTSMSNETMTDIFNASKSVMFPYNPNNAKLVVTSIVVRSTGQNGPDGQPKVEGRVCWSRAQGPGAQPYAFNSIQEVPEGFRNPSSSFIRADVTMSYEPMFGASILKWATGHSRIDLGEHTPWPVRSSQQVVWPSDSKTPCATT